MDKAFDLVEIDEQKTLIDRQINGLSIPSLGLHCDFWHQPDVASIDLLRRYLYAEGVSAIYPTLITAAYEEIDSNLEHLKRYVLDSPSQEALTDIHGIHIEGGLISQAGIHPHAYMSEMNIHKVSKLIDKYPGLIKLWTLCPLQDPKVSQLLQNSDIQVAFGHSKASLDEAERAFDEQGVRLVTHWPNAMHIIKDPLNPSRFDHRKPSHEYLDFLTMDRTEAISWANKKNLSLGLGFSAYHRSDISITLICGSVADMDLHLAPELVKMISARKNPSQIILVSDAVAYDAAELKAGQPLALRGGRVSLTKHLNNYREILKDSNNI